MKRDGTARLALLLLLTSAGLGWAVWLYWQAGVAALDGETAPFHIAQDFGPVQPLPQSLDLDADQVELGRRLFHDVRLSVDGTVSCASCHALDRYGVDGLPVSRGVQGRRGEVNAPTVYNSGFNFRQFWDGRAASLEEQAGGPIENPVEMAASWPQLLARLERDDGLRALANRAYGRRLDQAMVRAALATFERSLITPGAPFDRYLRGDAAALDERARLGWQRFRDLGCIACHQGINLGGNMYATLGAMGDYFGGRPATRADLGLFNLTGREGDRHKFKVPGLRNVAETAPYFHDGRIATLDEAVEVMARLQLGLDLAEEDRDSLVAFLNSLTGRPQGGRR